jgi:hypothetical protein
MGSGDMTKTQMFPTVLILLDVCAAVMYVPKGDWRHIGYWLSAALLTYFVTF